MDWTKAEQKLDEIKDAIETTVEMMKTMGAGVDLTFYRAGYNALRSRFNSGERTEELFREISEFSI